MQTFAIFLKECGVVEIDETNRINTISLTL